MALRKICVGERGVGPVEEVPVGGGRRADREQQRRRLTGGAGDGEQGTADTMPGSAAGSTTVRIVRLLRGAERVAALPQGVGHQPQHLLGASG